MEILHLVAGDYDNEALKRVAPKADHSLFTYSMAYGPRISLTIETIISALRVDPDTRQAVLFVASPLDGPTSDLPCTLTIQFLVRDGELHAIVSMRSWDLCRGLPYDLMMFSGLLCIMSRCLHYEPGKVIVQAGSAHIYREWADRLPSTSAKYWVFNRDAPRSWTEAKLWALEDVQHLQKGDTPYGIDVLG